MTRRTLVALLAAAVAACSHSKQVSRTDVKPRAQEGEGAREVPRDRSRPPVPAAPSGLLAEGGGAKVKEALANRGLLAHASRGDALDDSASAALRKFQQQEGLAATGFPDRETLRRLGLEPKQVYRTAE